MDKISVIIPVYNVEPYIRRCLDSVINQTYKNLEIICVNDGSTDDSGKICDEYAEKDSRIRVFHKANGGLSSARNVGLRNFTGQYVGFVDSDDWIEPDMYEVLHNLITSKNVAVSVVSVFIDTGMEVSQKKNLKPITNEIILQRDLLTYIFRLDYYNAFHIVVWNKLFSADILLNNNLYFDEKIKYGEDNLFTSSVFLTDGCTGAFIDKPMYHYCKRDTSLMGSTPVKIKAANCLSVFESVLELFEKKGYGDLTILVKKEYCYVASLYAEEAIEAKNKKILLDMQKEMRLYLEDYVEVTEAFPERIERVRKLLDVKMEDC